MIDITGKSWALYIYYNDKGWTRFGVQEILPNPLIDYISIGDGRQHRPEDIAILEGAKNVFQRNCFSMEELRSLIVKGEIKDILNHQTNKKEEKCKAQVQD